MTSPISFSLFSILLFSSSLSSSSGFYVSVPLRIVKSQALWTFTNHVPNRECSADLIRLVTGVSNSELWALKMLDASGKMNSGLFNGNFNAFGDYDQCLSISEKFDGRTMNGQYCTVVVEVNEEALGVSSPDIKNALKLLDQIQLNRTLPLLLGICIPKSCSIKNLQNLLGQMEQILMQSAQITMIDELCSYQDKSEETTSFDVLVYSFFVFILFVIFSSTIYDAHLRYSGKNPNIFVIFSAYTNLEKLLSQTSNSNTDLSSLNGLKMLSCGWLILAHVAVCTTFLAKNPLEALTKWKYYPSGIFVWSAFYSLTNFFTISGFLVSYLYLRRSEKKSSYFLWFYFERFIRLAPALLATTLIHSSILKHLTDGPYGPLAVKLFTENCNQDWWKGLYYFFGWSKFEKCIPHIWFLSIDSQFYMWAPLILLFLRKYPKMVLTGLSLALLTGIVYSSRVTIYKELGATLFDWNSDFQEYIFMSSLYHSPSWIIGIILGYLIYQNQIKISKTVNIILWIVSLSTMWQLVFGQIVLVSEEYDVYRAALWNGLSKTLWSLCLGYIIFSCTTGNGGWINFILSHPVCRVLGKLTYSIYLVHFGVLVILWGNEKETSFLSHSHSMSKFIQVYSVTLVCSLFLYLGFEAPIMALKYHAQENKKVEDVKTKKV